jgi:hypothetical protein
MVFALWLLPSSCQATKIFSTHQPGLEQHGMLLAVSALNIGTFKLLRIGIC